MEVWFLFCSMSVSVVYRTCMHTFGTRAHENGKERVSKFCVFCWWFGKRALYCVCVCVCFVLYCTVRWCFCVLYTPIVLSPLHFILSLSFFPSFFSFRILGVCVRCWSLHFLFFLLLSSRSRCLSLFLAYVLEYRQFRLHVNNEMVQSYLFRLRLLLFWLWSQSLNHNVCYHRVYVINVLVSYFTVRRFASNENVFLFFAFSRKWKREWVILYRPHPSFSPPHIFHDNRIQQVKKRLAFCIILVCAALLLAHLTMFYKFLFVSFTRAHAHAYSSRSSNNRSISTIWKWKNIVENRICTCTHKHTHPGKRANARIFYISALM